MSRQELGSKRIGVLSLHNSKETKAICNAVAALGHQPVWLREENLDLAIDDDTPAIEPEVDLVVNRLLLTNDNTPLDDLELAMTLAGAYPFLNSPAAVLRAIHKYATAMALADAGVPTPNSRLVLDPTQTDTDDDHLSQTRIDKPAIGTHGDDAWKFDADDAPSQMRLTGHTIHQSFLEQETDQSDVRVYVVDGEVIAAMSRTASGGDWRANVARGGTTADMMDELSAHARELALRATDAIGLDIAGVDLMRHDERWIVLEVNPTAGFKGLFDASGTSPAPYIARTAIQRAGGHVEEDTVASLADTLDDSVPACKPNLIGKTGDSPTIGVTETVTLEGNQQSKQVVAKVDTGADRTSIDVELAATIGAGPITEYTTVRSATREQSQTRPLVEIYIAIDDQWESVTASVEDRSHMNYPVILGKDVLSGYRIDIDKRADTPSQPRQTGGVSYADEE